MTRVELPSVFETTDNERWTVLNSLIILLESLDYCLGVLVQVITLRSTPCEPVCSDYLCRLLTLMGVNVIWLACCVICQILLNGLFCVSVAIKDNVWQLLLCVYVCAVLQRKWYKLSQVLCEVGTYVFGIRD